MMEAQAFNLNLKSFHLSITVSTRDSRSFSGPLLQSLEEQYLVTAGATEPMIPTWRVKGYYMGYMLYVL